MLERLPKVCIVSSCGGHLTEMLMLRDAYQAHEHFFVLNQRVSLSPALEGRTCFITHAERNIGVVWNLWEAVRILRHARPTIILSTGAGPVVPFALVGLCLGIPTVYIETVTRIDEPSLTGRLMYFLAARFYYQWEGLRSSFPKGTFVGGLLS